MIYEEKIRQEIIDDPDNADFKAMGYKPLFSANPKARIVLIGQAPGIRAQESGRLWQDQSGERLMKFLAVDEATFFNPSLFAHLPMDFYFPGKGPNGDKKPRKGFAKKWHPLLLKEMKEIRLFILIGKGAQDFYLGPTVQKNLTETVRHYRDYLPKFFPIVHPSPRNQIWMHKNPWFEKEVLPALQTRVDEILSL